MARPVLRTTARGKQGPAGPQGERGPQGPQGPQGERGLPGVNAVPADEAVGTYLETEESESRAGARAAVAADVATPGNPIHDALTDTTVAREMDGSTRYFPERWYFGPKGEGHEKGLLHVEYHGHFLAQRFAFSGTWDSAIRTAPTIEIAPAAPFVRPDLGGDYINKVGKNAINPVTCFQVYAFGHGDTDSRSYFCIEPHIYYDTDTEQYSGEHVINSYASGTEGPGVLPVQWVAGNINAFRISPGAVMEIQRQLIVGIDAINDGPFQIHRQNANDLPITQMRQYSDNSAGAYVALLKYRGTKESPAPPNLNDILGRVVGGTTSAAGTHAGAEVRFLAQENWVHGSAQGAKVLLQATKAGTATRRDVAQFDVPTNVRDTSARLVYWDGSNLVEKRVIVGDPDSGGVGFRSLLVSN